MKSKRKLAVGTKVRVYRTHHAAPHWFCDPATGKIADPPAFSMKPWVWGTIITQHTSGGYATDVYTAAVTHEGRELCIRMSGYWMRRSWERAPEYPEGMKPRDVKPLPAAS